MENIGVIGYGYWGPNLVRNFSVVEGANVVAVADLKPERLAVAKRYFPGVKVLNDYREILNDPEIHAVAIATPVSSHFAIARAALKADKHVFVEKPLTETAAQATELIDESLKRNRVLMVDHTFIYTPAVQKIRELVDLGELGDIYYFDSIRVNLGLFQPDVSVVWDLAVHDLAILDYVLGIRPLSISATGARHFGWSSENVAYMTLHFDGPTIAHINVNWLAPVKIRQILIGGSRKMVLYDDTEATEKVKIYDKGVDNSTTQKAPDEIYKLLVNYRLGDIVVPYLSTKEALLTECEHFLDCIVTGEKPLTDGQMGLRVVELLEAISRSMKSHGQPQQLRRV